MPFETRVANGSVSVRHAVVVSADGDRRFRWVTSLEGLRWQVEAASGGAEAMASMEQHIPEALIVDNWLPDLEVDGFIAWVRQAFPSVDILRADGAPVGDGPRSPRRHELLHVLRAAEEDMVETPAPAAVVPEREPAAPVPVIVPSELPVDAALLPGMIGNSSGMRELARMVRLVAPRDTTVLIEGETGTGKEVVSRAIHRLSPRSQKPFVTLNCAAIPEALLEAELFGHTRGAFTGAVQSRTGRIEAANGGTLFLDEIGEMPLPLQAKMLRFLENGELQRVGDNETVRVDVRVIAATHRDLERLSQERTFRLDLYHRLAVFPVVIPALRERAEDIPLLATHILNKLGETMPQKRLSQAALETFQGYDWPGNVRELGHVLERAAILAEDRPEIGMTEVILRRKRA
ncbi:sigma-54-dependent Fis family transcriptional regulator [Terriglobus albidus]|uniref:Sigma-54-dependent Fis family transcriptional regulator n=1 Tax=Terriglobus albidus TaxID=1592106 RepID=A0A5B9ECI4_9BACT|nr:sigma-54 dependent transcriptional regulator [Terriglobus albidus]QEE29354.1 sigma-54-dependent Fis family transcriptional regulator [Terriglobus albidus]